MSTNNLKKQKVLLIRLDKIGDLICTLPVDQVLSDQYEIVWVVQKGLGAVVDLGSQKRRYYELDKSNPKKSAFELQKILQDFKPDAAISFQAPWWVNFELFKARIPIRAGVLSQWHSFLFLNQGLRQKRSLAEKHEFDYNLELVQKTFLLPATKIFYHFEIKPKLNPELLKQYNLTAHQYQVVHPGMMGSALNWKQSQYISLIEQQILKGKTLVITGTDADRIYLDKIYEKFKNTPQVIWLQSKLNLTELVQILAQAECVVAPSTGVAHLAASCGVTTYGIYSPIRVHAPRRWAPRGQNVSVSVPQVNCPAQHFCLLEKCPHYNCMDHLQLPAF